MTGSPDSPRSRHETLEGLTVHYLEAGDGPPLILLHGTGIDSAELTYGPSIRMLAQRHRVIALDWPGHGRSAIPTSPYTVPDCIRLLRSLTEELDLPSFSLGGFSLGGAVALGFTLEHPDRVERLALVSSHGLGRTVHVPIIPYLALRTPYADVPVWAGLRRSRRLLRGVLDAFVFGDRRAVTEELVREVHEQLQHPGIERSFMGWLRGELGLRSFTTSYRDRLEELEPPTLLLHGSRDLIVPASRAREAARRMPRAKLSILRGCGHWLPREASAAFRWELLNFLSHPA